MAALRVAALMHVLDLVFSGALLSVGWMQEANPLAAAVFEHGGLAGLVGFKMFFLIAAVAVISQALDHSPRLAGLACAVTLTSGALAVGMCILVVAAWWPTISL